MKIDSHPKHTVKVNKKEFLKARKWDILQWASQSPDLNPSEYALQLLNTKLNAETYNQEAIEGGCGKGLREQVQGKSSKNFHPSIKNYPRTWNFVNLSSRFWSSEFEELCIKMAVIPKQLKQNFSKTA